MPLKSNVRRHVNKTSVLLVVVALCSVRAGAQQVSASPASSSASASDMHCKHAPPKLSRSTFEVLTSPGYQAVPVVALVEFLPPGVVGGVVILESSGYRELDGAAFDALSKIICTFGAPLTEPKRALQQFVFKPE